MVTLIYTTRTYIFHHGNLNLHVYYSIQENLYITDTQGTEGICPIIDMIDRCPLKPGYHYYVPLIRFEYNYGVSE